MAPEELRKSKTMEEARVLARQHFAMKIVTNSLAQCTLHEADPRESNDHERPSEHPSHEEINNRAVQIMREQDSAFDPGNKNPKESALGKRCRSPSSASIDRRPMKALKQDWKYRKTRKSPLVALPLELRRIIIKHVVGYSYRDYLDGYKPYSIIGLAYTCRAFYEETCEVYYRGRPLHLHRILKPHHFFEWSQLFSSRERRTLMDRAQDSSLGIRLNYEPALRPPTALMMGLPHLLTGLPRLEWITHMSVDGWGSSSTLDLLYSLRAKEMKRFQFPNLTTLTLVIRDVCFPVPCPWIMAPAEVDEYFPYAGVLPSEGGLRAGVRLMETLLGLCPRLKNFLMRPSLRKRYGELKVRSATWGSGLDAIGPYKDRICRELESPDRFKVVAKMFYMLAVLTRFVRRSLRHHPRGTPQGNEIPYMPMTHSQLEAMFRIYKGVFDTVPNSVILRDRDIEVWNNRRDF